MTHLPLTIRDRVDRAGAAIEQYGEDIEESNLIDFLADAMHWCRVSGHCFDKLLTTAANHFKTETLEETGVLP